MGTSWALTRALGYQGAFAFFAKGEHLRASTAHELGLVQEVVAPDDLLATADGWCDRIAAMPPHALRMAKPLLRAAADASWDGALALEEFAEPNCFTTQSFRDSVHGMFVLARRGAVDLTRLRADLGSGAWHRRHRELAQHDEADFGYRLLTWPS